MSPAKSHGHGLRPEDLSLIFPDEETQAPSPPIGGSRPTIDYKRRASGERGDLPGPEVEERSWPIGDLEPEEAPPDLSSEPWPSPIEDAPIEENPEMKKEAVQALPTPGSMIEVANPKPQPPEPAERKKLEALPSDREWFLVMRKIYRGELPAPAKGK